MPKKWDDRSKPADKILRLYSLLMVSNRLLSLTEISDLLNCSKATTLNLLNQLEAANIGILEHIKENRKSYYRLVRPKEPPKLSFNPEALSQLAMCHNFLSHVLPPNLNDSLESTVLEAAKFVTGGIDPKFTKSLGSPLFKGRINYEPFEEQMQTLIKAITGHLICSVSYRSSWNGQEKQYDFAPKQLTIFHEALYVDGWKVSPTGEAVNTHPNTLAVHRVLKAEITDRDSSSLPSITPDNDSFGLIEDEVFETKIKFNRKVAAYIAEREWSVGEKKTINSDGSLTLTLKAKSQDELLAWVLSFGHMAKIMAPKWLRESLINNVFRLLADYGLELDYPDELDDDEIDKNDPDDDPDHDPDHDPGANPVEGSDLS
jgi:predicted DNA-binding transcriptional regulator YafY